MVVDMVHDLRVQGKREHHECERGTRVLVRVSAGTRGRGGEEGEKLNKGRHQP